MKGRTLPFSSTFTDTTDPDAVSQGAFKKIMDSFLDVICTIDKDGLFLLVGAASQSLWGYKPEELIGMQSMDLVLEDDKAVTKQAFSQIKAGKAVTNFENRFRRKDNTIIPLVWSARWDKGEQVMYCIARDGREKKEIEMELQDRERRLTRVQQMARIGGWEYDVIRQQTRWTSDQVYTIYGITRKQYPELSVEVFHSLVHPDDQERVKASLYDKSRLHNHFLEHRIIRPDGRIVFVRQSIEVVFEREKPVLLKGVVQDISDLKEADLLLIANERRYRSLVQNGFDMINILDAEGNYLYVAESIYRIMGYSPKDLLGKNAFDLIHPEDVVRMAKAFARLYTQHYVEDVPPYRFRNSKGEWRWLESKGVNMLHDNAINGLVINSRDITDKKLMQERFEKQIKEWQKKMSTASIQAQEQERAQLGRELHDNVNQVLTTVKLYNELCLDNHADQQLLITKSVGYLTDCINEIRSISKRLSSPTLGEISLEDSIKELVNSLQLIDKVQINLLVEAAHQKIEQDVHLGIYRIVQEHMTNVLKHAQANNVDIHISVTTSAVVVTIKDDGVGFNVKEQRQGIGINNMHGRTDSLNGTLTISSKPSAGCTLYLFIPLDEMIGA